MKDAISKAAIVLCSGLSKLEAIAKMSHGLGVEAAISTIDKGQENFPASNASPV